MKKVRMSKYIFIVIFIVLLQSCAVGPDFHEPEVNSPENFRFSNPVQDSILNLKWWEMVKDPQLESLIETGLRENKDVLIAASRIEQARINVGYTKADYGPKFDAYGNVNKSNMLLNMPQDTNLEIFNAGLSVNWELDFWGKYRRSTEASKAELLASLYGRRALQIALISEIATNYFLLLDYRTRLDIAEQTYEIRKQALEIIQARFDQGYTHIIDVNQAQIQMGIAEASIPTFKRMVAVTEHNLDVLLGRNPEPIDTDKNLTDYPLPVNIPSGIPSDVLQRRPDVLQQEQYYRAQNARVGIAQAMRFPSISLTGLLGIGTNDLSNLTRNGLGWSAGANLFAPVFEWGKNKKRVEMEREVAKQSLYQYENTVLNAFREVENALVEVKTLKRELEVNKFILEAAKNASKLSYERYYQGVTSYLEVIENQRQEFDANLSYSQNFQELLNSYVKLYKALGGGWISEAEIDKYISQQYDDPSQVKKDTVSYQGQTPDLHLTQEEVKARKDAEKARRKLEKEQKKQAKKAGKRK
jgi:multidrug efflux system outer membrane protein